MVGLADMTRKLLLCLLEQNKLEDAAETFYSMDESTKGELLTLYLGFKLGLRRGDHELAAKCLEDINSISGSNPQYLYACCVDAQTAGDKFYAMKSLEHLSMRQGSLSSSPIHFPALLRSLIRIQTQVLSGEECADVLCHTFERGKLLSDYNSQIKSCLPLTCGSKRIDSGRQARRHRQKDIYAGRVRLVL